MSFIKHNYSDHMMRLICQAGHMAQITKAHNNWSPGPTRGNLPWNSTGLHLPPSPTFFLFYLFIYYQLTYRFLLSSSLF